MDRYPPPPTPISPTPTAPSIMYSSITLVPLPSSSGDKASAVASVFRGAPAFTVLREASCGPGNSDVVARWLLGKLSAELIQETEQASKPTASLLSNQEDLEEPLVGAAAQKSSSKYASFEHDGGETFYVLEKRASPSNGKPLTSKGRPCVIFFICNAETATTPGRVAFSFLNSLSSNFLRRAETDFLGDYVLAAENFGETMTQLIQSAGKTGTSDDPRIQRVNDELFDVSQVLVRNIDVLLSRGEKINTLVDKTQRMAQSAFKFQSSATQLKNHLFWQKVRMWGWIALITSLILSLVIVGAFCGGLDVSKCSA